MSVQLVKPRHGSRLCWVGQRCSVHAVLHGCHKILIAAFLQAAQERAANRQSGQVVRRKVHGAATKLVMMYISIESQNQKQQKAGRL